MNVFIHPSAIVDDGAVLGEGTKVWHFSHICGTAKIGKNCIISQSVYIDRDVVIGDGVKIQNNVNVYKGVVLGDYVFCGPSMTFTNVINPRSHVERKTEMKTTRVGHHASFGANVTVVCGVAVGPYAFVGAGSVVSRDVPAYALVYGNPARRRGWVCECGVKLDAGEDEASCASCGKKYRIHAESIEALGEC